MMFWNYICIETIFVLKNFVALFLKLYRPTENMGAHSECRMAGTAY